MIEQDAIDLVGEMSVSTGVNIAIGVNVYVDGSNSLTSMSILVDPSGIVEEDEEKLEAFCEERGLQCVEAWNDWGRYLKITKLRQQLASAYPR